MSSQRVSDFMSRSILDPKKSRKQFFDIVVYPQNNVRELARIMNDIRIDRLPVLFSPWNKRQIGFIELKKISVFLND